LAFALFVGCSARSPVPETPSPSATSAQTPQKEKVVLSLVHLTGPEQLFSKEDLEARLGKAFGDQDFKLTYAGSTSFLKRGEWLFQIHQYQEPYFDKGAFGFGQIEDPRLRKALEDHAGWVAVDATAWPREIEAEEGYKTVGKILAELSEGGGSGALYLPATGQFISYRDDTSAALRSDPLASFERALED
jgi:hypothetical protein